MKTEIKGRTQIVVQNKKKKVDTNLTRITYKIKKIPLTNMDVVVEYIFIKEKEIKKKKKKPKIVKKT